MIRYIMAALILIGASAAPQDAPPVLVTPSSATVLLGESHSFRAVNREGRPAYSVRWNASSTEVEFEPAGSDVVAYFRSPGNYVINAYSPDGSSSAKIKVVNWRDFPQGTVKWSVEQLPGCRNREIKPGIPAPGSTNDVFAVEECPRGTVVRALTAEGMENWRTWISEKNFDPNSLSKYEPKPLSGRSLCDNVKPEMTKDEVLKLVSDSKLNVPASDQPKNIWLFEDSSISCKITFADDKVVKKQKIIANQ
jgi:hypothetical protein